MVQTKQQQFEMAVQKNTEEADQRLTNLDKREVDLQLQFQTTVKDLNEQINNVEATANNIRTQLGEKIDELLVPLSQSYHI